MRGFQEQKLVEGMIAYALELDYDDNRRWDIVWHLCKRGGTVVFRAAARLLKGARSKARALGADILGQASARHGKRGWAYARLLPRVQGERSAGALASLLSALHHAGGRKALPVLACYMRNPDAWVRWTIACGMSCHESRPAIDCLIQLSKDRSALVRDWATFGLGSLFKADTPQVREALKLRLKDRSISVRAEAVKGLAERRIPEAKAAVKEWLKSGREIPDQVWESAELLGIPIPAGVNVA